MDIEEFELAMNAFNFGQHQDALTYIETLKQVGFTLADLYTYVETKKEILNAATERKHKDNPSRICSDCKAIMLLLPVNVSLETQTGDDSKSVWLCRNANCMHTIYNKQTLEEIVKEA